MKEVEDAKKQIQFMQKKFSEQVSKVNVVGERMYVPCRDCNIEVYFYKSKRSEVSPLLFQIHGGGFVFGDAALNDGLCDKLRNSLDINVVSINYRLAPEFPYPAAVNDVYDVIKYFSQNAEKYGIDKNNMAVMGGSAGANLATVVARLAKELGEFEIKCQVLCYPVLDILTDPFSKPFFKQAIPPTMAVIFNELYAKKEDYSNPNVSPVYASIEQLKGLPPTVIITAGLDSLYAEGEKYASMLMQAGVPVLVKRYPEAIHGFVESRYDKIGSNFQLPEFMEGFSENVDEMADDAISLIINMLKIFMNIRTL